MAANVTGRKRPLRSLQEDEPPPSRGGRAYSQDFRRNALNQLNAGVPVDQIGVSDRTLRRWRQRQEEQGTANAYERQGNHEMRRFGPGDIALLIHYRLTFPKAQADEIITYIANNSFQHSIYSRQDITLMEKRLGFTRKVGSSRAFQSLLAHNQMRRQLFWSQPPPVGVHGLDRNRLIDIDEGGFSITSSVRSHGKAYRCVRVVQSGSYTRTRPWNLILAIDAQGRCWHRLSRENTNQFVYRDFVQTIMNSLPPQGTPAFVARTFMHDNLSAHLAATVTNAIVGGGHHVIPRPPYMPSDGPIEYAINQVQNGLNLRMNSIRNDDDLLVAMNDAIGSLNGLGATFDHCGYT